AHRHDPVRDPDPPGVRMHARSQLRFVQHVRHATIAGRVHSRLPAARGARTARPGLAAVTLPPSTTGWPPTITYGIPRDGIVASSYVDRSMTVAGSNTVRSASAPTLMRPLFAIAGVRRSSRRAGSSVIRRTASTSGTTLSSRTYLPSTLAYVPDVRGWPRPFSMKPSLAIITSGLAMAARVCSSDRP